MSAGRARRWHPPAALALAAALVGLPSLATPRASDPLSGAADQAADQSEPDDLELDPAEPDFTVVNLPTTLRLPSRRGAFRVTHRFGRPLGQGDFGDLAADLFGLDGGALVGLEFRFGLTPNLQLGVLRTSTRAVVFFGQQALAREGRLPVALALHASIEGLDNFGEEHSPGLALVFSKRLGQRGALYAMPAFVANTRTGPDRPGDDSAFMLRLGTRLGLGGGLALVGEASPRLAGYDGGSTHVTFGLEKRVGGHAFQLNFSNDLGTTPAQVARGRQGPEEWFLGFNISRKFF